MYLLAMYTVLMSIYFHRESSTFLPRILNPRQQQLLISDMYSPVPKDISDLKMDMHGP